MDREPLETEKPASRASNRDLHAEVEALRRRLWIERGLLGGALLLLLSLHLAPRLFPGAWAVYLQNQPVVAMRDREALAEVLRRVKAAPDTTAAAGSLLAQARLGRVDPRRITPREGGPAAAALKRAAGERAERGVIYVEGAPVVALPDVGQAEQVLESVKQRATEKLKRIDTAPEFKEQVEVRPEPASFDLWGDREVALGLLSGGGADAEGEHVVRNGESAWLVARRARCSVAELGALNPGLNLARLRVGQTLKLGKPAPPLVTIISSGVITETIPAPYGVILQRQPRMYVGKTVVKRSGRPGAQRVTYRVTCENGKVVRREVVSRERTRPPRDAILVVGARPRPR